MKKLTLKERLKTIRELRDMSQIYVLTMAGWKVPSARLAQWEAGRAEPGLKELLMLSKIYQVSPCWLAFGMGSEEKQIYTHRLKKINKQG